MNSYENEFKKLFKYERNIQLNKYKFRSINLFIVFLEILNNKIYSDSKFFEIELVNDFGILRFNNFDELLEELRNSGLVSCMNIKIFDKKNMHSIIINYEQFDGIKHYSFIKMFSNNENWIKKSEKEILEYLSTYKNRLSIFLNPIINISLVAVLSTIILFIFYKLFFNIDILKIRPNSKDSIIAVFLELFTLIILKILQFILLPRFKIKMENIFYKRIKIFIKTNPEEVVMSLFFTIIGTLLGFLLSKR